MQCPMCPDYSVPTFKLLLRHIGRVHGNSSDFFMPCGLEVNGTRCATTFTNFYAYKRHLRKKHREVTSNTELTTERLWDEEVDSSEDPGEATEVNCCEESEDESTTSSFSRELTQPQTQKDLNRQVALWILKLKEEKRLPQSTVDEVLSGVTELCSNIVSHLRDELHKVLNSAKLSPSDIPGFDDILSDDSPYTNPFRTLQTQHLQMAYYRKDFNLVDPVQVTLGTEYVWTGEGASRHLKEIEKKYTYVPVLKVLENIMMCPAVCDEVMRGHQRSDELLEDFCDSPKFKSHPLFGSKQNALQILLYFDECELCNPLGSFRKKHKLGCYYFTLGNIHPIYRSSLNSIQLLCLVEAPVLDQYGHDKVLELAIKDIRKLEQGVVLNTCEGPRQFYGSVATLSGDNPGSSAVTGFKESGSAFRLCRQCMATRDNFRLKFHEKYFELRTPLAHQRHLQLIRDNPSLQDHYSMTYGVNRESILNSLLYFDVANECVVPDLMHDVLEGYLPYKTKLMLKHFISIGLFNHEDVYKITTSFDYGCESTAIPSPLTATILQSADKTRLGQTAVQMWTLGRMLPVMIGHFVPQHDEHWIHYIELLDIVDLIFSPIVHPNTPGYLEVTIEENLEMFVTLYGKDRILPKMHFLIHIPRLLERFGPLVRYWTMRFEAKHQYFKSLASRMGNFINITYSLALRQQCYQCYVLQSHSGYCTKHLKVGKGNSVKVGGTSFKDLLLSFNLTEGDTVFCPVAIEALGMKLKPGVVVIESIESKSDPSFCKIEQLFIINNDLLLGVQYLNILEYSVHHHSWIVQEKDGCRSILPAKKIATRQVLMPRPVRDTFFTKFFLTLKFSL